MYLFHSAGRSSCGKIALTGHSSTHRPQSMQVSGSMKSWVAVSNSGSFLVGWMQSTGQTSTHDVSLVPMQGSAIMWGIGGRPQPVRAASRTAGADDTPAQTRCLRPFLPAAQPVVRGHNGPDRLLDAGRAR